MNPVKRLASVLILLIFIPALCLADNLLELPVDLSPAPVPNPKCYTKDGYQDESLTVRMEKVVYEKVQVNLAWIEVASPTQLRTAIYGDPSDLYQEGNPGVIVRANNAVVAVNGDLFTRRQGILYRQGVALRKTDSAGKDSLFIDENGDFHVIPNSDPELMVEYLRSGHTIVNSFSFGPALVVDGKAQQIPSDYWFEPEGRCQRTAICQVGKNQYLFVEVIGRTLESRGFTLQQFANFLETLGVQCGYNLDGGDSTVMYLGRTYYDMDHHYNGEERVMSDIVYVCSAVDPASWQ